MRKTVIILAFLFVGCRENIVDIEVGNGSSQLVIGGLINTDSSVLIKVTHTVNVLATDAEYNVKNASVLLYENDVVATRFHYDPGDAVSGIDDIYFSQDRFIPTEGNTYSIQVDAPGYESVSASTRIPKEVPILEVEIGTTPVQVGEFLNGVNANITFPDPPGEANFYSIIIREENRIYHEYDEFGQPIEESGYALEIRSKALLPRLDDKIEFNGKSNFRFRVLYVSDIAFNGRLYTHDFLMHAPTGGELTVFLNHITEEHYLYGTTSQLQQLESAENPFSQPVQVFSNIENGLGIFSGYHASSLVVNPEED